MKKIKKSEIDLKELEEKLNNASEKEIIDMLAEVMASSIINLVRPCIEKRLTQFLPLIKEGLTK